MRATRLAQNLWQAARSQPAVLLAVLPGLVLTMLHSTALDLPRADIIGALDSDHYRIQWIVGSYLLGSAVGMALTGFLGSYLGLARSYLAGLAAFTVASGGSAAMTAV